VRPSWFEKDTANEEATATPHYNSSVLMDMLYESHLKTIYNSLAECSEMRDAICLAKVWLKQRSLTDSMPLNGFILSNLMVYLLQEKKISPQMSSYQIFRMLLNTFVTSDWRTKGITLCDTADLQTFHDNL
jgi:U3 small nucleolar RNA-associated protein 22